MSYRDEDEARRQRVENLEHDLRDREGEHVENEALKKRIAELERADAERKAREAPTTGAAAGATSPERAPPMKRPPPTELTARPDGKTASRGWMLAILVPLLSCHLAICGTAYIPPQTAAVGWLACPSSSEYTTTTSSMQNGSSQWTLVCHLPGGATIEANSLLMMLGSILIGLLPLALAIGFLVVRGLRRARAR
jgi:hypothetical protein